MAPALLLFPRGSYHRDVPIDGRGVLVLVPLLWLLLSPAPDSKAAAGSRQEVEFGVDVARKGLWQEARFRFEKAIAADPDNPEALNDLAVALEQQGDFDKAREAYEKALKLKPGNVYIQQNFDLFREADDKRNRKAKKKKPTPQPQP
jgi:Tfp pilus assembly protein PilF